MANAAEVLVIARKILEAEMEIVHLKKRLEDVLSGESPVAQPSLPPISRGMSTDSGAYKVMEYARKRQGTYINAASAARETGLSQEEASRALYRLRRKGDLKSPQRGYYILPSDDSTQAEEVAEATP